MAMQKIVAEGLPTRYSRLQPHRRRTVRDKYVRIQKGLCWYCDAPLDKEPPDWIKEKPIDIGLYPNGFFNHPVHLQHDHNTDMTEGAVHARCNAVLWEYEKR